MRLSAYRFLFSPIIRHTSCGAIIVVAFFVAQSALFAQPSAPAQTQGVGASSQEVPLPVQECLRKGQEKLEKEGPYKSLDAFRACARQFPDSAFVRFWLGTALFLGRQPADAVTEMQEALKIDPDNRQIRAMLGKLYSFDEEKLSLAEELLNSVLESNPEHDDARIDLGRVYGRRKEMDKAFREFGRVLAGEKRFAVYHLELGRILMGGGLYEDARKQFERSLVLEPGFQAAEEQLKILDREAAKTGTRESPSGSPTAPVIPAPK
jgi:tetratricopeptide (TPR) repeat protein